MIIDLHMLIINQFFDQSTYKQLSHKKIWMKTETVKEHDDQWKEDL